MKVHVYAHMYMFSTFNNGFMSFYYISHIYIYILHIYMLSSIVKEATTFEIKLRGHKQATAHSHEHTKNSICSKNNFRDNKIRIRICQLIPKPPEIVRIGFGRHSDNGRRASGEGDGASRSRGWRERVATATTVIGHARVCFSSVVCLCGNLQSNSESVSVLQFGVDNRRSVQCDSTYPNFTSLRFSACCRCGQDNFLLFFFFPLPFLRSSHLPLFISSFRPFVMSSLFFSCPFFLFVKSSLCLCSSFSSTSMKL